MTLLFDLRGSDDFATSIASRIGAQPGAFEMRSFPDGETYLRVDNAVRGQRTIILANLAHPNSRILPLLLFADTLRAQAADSVELIAPYLPYMRQDAAFHSGESVSSRHFAALLSAHFDRLVTVDAHLHRHRALDEIYPIASSNLTATGLLAAWVRSHVGEALLVGPDEESAQWVSAVAREAQCDWQVLRKTRLGDSQVIIEADLETENLQLVPVLIDDMISTGATLKQCCELLRRSGLKPPHILAVHGVFAGTSYQDLKSIGARSIVTTNSIPHPSNAIDLSPLFSPALADVLP